MNTCSAGMHVEDDKGRTGVIASVVRNYCYVDIDGGAKNQLYLPFQLNPVGQHARDTASLPTGHYECYGIGGAGASAACSYRAYACVSQHYMGQDINLAGGGRYTDKGGRAGTYSYDPRSQTLTFASGPYRGWSSKYLSANKIGLVPRFTGFWNIACDRKP